MFTNSSKYYSDKNVNQVIFSYIYFLIGFSTYIILKLQETLTAGKKSRLFYPNLTFSNIFWSKMLCFKDVSKSYPKMNPKWGRGGPRGR